MGSGFSKMKKQAKMMEQQLETMRNEMKNKLVTGVSGNGLVTISLNGNKEMQTIIIKPDCVDPHDIEGLQDLIKAAHQDAYSKLEDSDSGLQLPF
jgi:nucleoid-associated protein EbfC